MYLRLLISILLIWLIGNPAATAQGPPFKSANPILFGMDGLWHPQAHEFLQDPERFGLKLVGIAEDDPRLVAWAQKNYGLSPELFFPDLKSMVKSTQPQGVALFDHPDFLADRADFCARKDIHLLLPPPLFTAPKEAQKIAETCRKKGIKVLVNYDQAWWGSAQRMHHIIRKKEQLGTIRRIHAQIGWSPKQVTELPSAYRVWVEEDPGLGALLFSHEALALSLWLLADAEPEKVELLTQHLTPDSLLYPDQVTAIVNFKTAQLVLEGSFHWPSPQKVLTVYGEKGYLQALDAGNMRMQTNRQDGGGFRIPAPKVRPPKNDPYDYWVAWIKDEVTPGTDELFSLDFFVKVCELQALLLEAYQETP
jgi:predicted dehydrogenase